MLELIQSVNSAVNNFIWGVPAMICIIGVGLLLTIKTKFLQIRKFPYAMKETLGRVFKKQDASDGSMTPFQAVCTALASTVGTGNIAGVAGAIAIGGPGAVFWMWVIALLGASSAFIESTLAQLYKVHGHNSFVGGPAYYMKKGLKQPWMGVLFAFLLIFTFGFAFNSVQSNTICAAFEEAFNIPPSLMGVILTSFTLVIIFGGIQRIAKVSSIIVPVMALGYIFLSLFIVIVNAKHLPEVIELIIANAFGWEQALSGGIGIALMQGIKRGLFSNETGMGSAPNVAASADVTHPVKQGLIQTLGVFTDTLVICTCTAFIILFSGGASKEVNGIKLTQMALNNEIGNIGTIYVAVAILFFAYSSILGNYYYGEANVRYITHQKWAIPIYRISVGGDGYVWGISLSGPGMEPGRYGNGIYDHL